MANIMMTDVCNLRCPYCFANEFVNKDTNEISEENFNRAVDFIVGDGSHSSVGLIGGEPTVHSQFEKYLRRLIEDDRVKTVVVYTNGILLDKYWDVICHPKVRILVNCNCPEDIGEKNYERLCRNLDYMIETRMFKKNVTLGINMYQQDFPYAYIIELLKKYHFHHVRVSITVPNMEDGRNADAHVYFERMKQRMFEFFHELLSNEIIPNYDCNKIPSCLITEEDVESFRKYGKNRYINEHIGRSNISDKIVKCSPVIDIRQDLTAVRCFGLSECTKQDIRNFSGIRELENYYRRTIDAYGCNTVYSEKCIDCHARLVQKCNGGCLAFKIKDILAMRDFSEQVVHKHAGAADR